MGGAHSAKQYNSAGSIESLQLISDERRDFIQKSLDDWCANLAHIAAAFGEKLKDS